MVGPRRGDLVVPEPLGDGEAPPPPPLIVTLSAFTAICVDRMLAPLWSLRRIMTQSAVVPCGTIERAITNWPRVVYPTGSVGGETFGSRM